MIEAGHYDETDDDIIADNFPSSGSGTVELDCVLVHLDRDASTEEVESEIAKLGLRPARLEELLAFGEAYPEVQQEFSVVALASLWVDSRSDRHFAYLDSYTSERHLALHLDEEGEWGAGWWLAVRE